MTPTLLRPVLIVFCLAQLVQGISTNTTDSGVCPLHDGTHRSVWSILGSCAITLLICVWHSIHFDIDTSFMERVFGVALSFFAPEVVVAVASDEWWEVHDKVRQFDQKGYDWSMTHSFFAEMGGFVYRDNEGNSRKIKSLEFLELCEANKIANPTLTVKEIRDKSKSDPLGKAILALQLLWFMLQVVVRGSEGLAITLIELDTVCMAVLSLFMLALWWDKPLRAQCPHVFYSPQEVKTESHTESLSHAWGSKPNYVNAWVVAHFTRHGKARSITSDEETTLVGVHSRKPSDTKSRALLEKVDDDFVGLVSILTTWTILGGLHLIAWNFDFPTKVEKMLWRVASLVLTGTPLAMLAANTISNNPSWNWGGKADDVIGYSGLLLGIVSRAVLVALMLASLRSLPCTAYQIVSWTQYIPHL